MPELTITLTHREARALANAAGMLAEIIAEAVDVEEARACAHLVTERVSALERALMRLDVELVAAGVER